MHSSVHSKPRFSMEVSCEHHGLATCSRGNNTTRRRAGNWVGPRIGLNFFSEKKKFFLPGFETGTLLPLALSHGSMVFMTMLPRLPKKLTVKEISNLCFRRTIHDFENTVLRSDGRVQFYQDLSDSVVSLTSASQDALQVYLLLSSRRSTINFASSAGVRGFRCRREAWYIDKCSSSPPQRYLKIIQDFYFHVL